MHNKINIPVVFLVTLFNFSPAFSLHDIACPNLFEYIRERDGYFGRITLSDLPLGNSTLRVRLSVESGTEPKGVLGRLSTELNSRDVIGQLKRGEPIKYRVDFPFPKNPPKLRDITLNDSFICNDATSNRFAFFELFHTIDASSESTEDEHKEKMVQLSTEVSSTHNAFPTLPMFSYPPIRSSTQVPLEHFIKLPWPGNANRGSDTASVLPVQGEEPKRHAACGREEITKASILTPFIHGGIPITRGQFPWLTAIYSKFSQTIRFICGGSLISQHTVVSAAHCFVRLSFDNVVVYLGRYNLDNYSEDGHFSRGIKKLILHPEFSKNLFSSDADIAILQLDTAVQYTQYIKPICLWSGPDELDQTAGNSGTVVGWGSQGSERTVASEPRMVNINIVNMNDCLRYSPLFRTVGTARTFCAGNGNDTGPCLGDSGGGFMIKRNGVWMLRGIVSAGPTLEGKCDLKDFVLYCDVAKHLSWVKDNMI